MAKSRKNPTRKKNLTTYKNKRKKMNQPEIRNVPTWDPNANITVKGFELDAIQSSVAHMQMLQQAVQSIMSRNIVNGTIVMDFEKLDPKTQRYVPMTEKEKESPRDEFNKMLQTFREAEINKAAGNLGRSTVAAQPEEKRIITGDPSENAEEGAKIIQLPGTEAVPETVPEGLA